MLGDPRKEFRMKNEMEPFCCRPGGRLDRELRVDSLENE